MKIRYLISVFILLPLINGCSSNNERSNYTKQYEEEQLQKELNLQIAADSTVYLSFCGLNLCDPFIESVKSAIKDKRIWNLEYSKNKTGAKCKANIYLTTREAPLEVDVLLTSMNDTITSICVMSDNYETRLDLVELYKIKYSEDLSNFESRTGENSYIWNFKNQKLRISNFYETEKELYVKNPKMNSPQNKYGVKSTNYFKSIVILYTDNELCERAAQLDKRESEHEQELKQKEIDRQLEILKKRAHDQDI